MPLFLVPVDLGKNELRNATMQNLASAPSTPKLGQMYFDTGLNQIGVCTNATGPVWAYLSAGGTSFGTPAVVLGTAAAAGSATTAVRTDATIVAFDATAPSTQAFGDAAAAGSAVVATRRDHKHAMPANPTLSSVGAPTADVPWASHKITGLLDPTSAQDAATKTYVDATAAGIDWKASVRAATTATGTLATAYANGQTIDGVTLATGDRILLKDQTSGSENGIYVVAASGAPTRATDADTAAELTANMAVFVEEGTVNADTGWIVTNNGAIVIGTTALTFTQFTGLGEISVTFGLTKSGNTVQVEAGGLTVAHGGTGSTTAAGARTNLGTPGKFAASYGDGSTTTFTIAHGLSTADLVVMVYTVSGGAVVIPDISVDSTNITIVHSVAPTTNAYRVVAHG